MSLKIIKLLEKKDNYKYYKNIIAYAIGDASEKWQEKLFQILINQSDEAIFLSNLKILSIALWRNENLILKIKDGNAKKIIDSLKNDLEEKIKDGLKTEQSRIIISRHLELILALLRKRSIENKILLPRSNDTKWIIDKLDEIEKIIKNNNYLLISYLEFNLDNKKKDAKVPDIIYVLRQYLTGNDDSNTIKISGIDFKDE